MQFSCCATLCWLANPKRPQLNLDPDVDFAPPDAGESVVPDDAGLENDAGVIFIDAGVIFIDAGKPTDAGLALATPSDACATYIACLQAIDPTLLEDEFINAYGPGGICWVNGAEAADFCDVQCRVELTNAQEIADIIPECYFPGLVPDEPDAGIGLDAGMASLDAGTASLDAGTASLDAGTASLDAGKASLDAGTASLDAGKASLDAGKASLDAG
ncbi:MAG: hypothetical protein GY822_12940, partial [Deltaproteobacteria bacterium]|nr:hypothetical protein [Deltaproteobacteria bacterium]